MDESLVLPETTPGVADASRVVAEGRRKIVDRLTGVMPRTADQAQRTGSAVSRLAADAADECRQRIRERPINAVLMGVALGYLISVGLRR